MFKVTEVFPAIFKGEVSHRFIGRVILKGIERECYIASSCHLSPLIPLNDKRVLLRKNAGNRTQYTLYALCCKKAKVLLDLRLANELLFDYFKKKGFSPIEREHKIGKYKSDLYFPLKKVIIEVKAVISEGKELEFGVHQGERALRQLQDLMILLDLGFKVRYCIVCMNCNTSLIYLKNKEPLSILLQKCIRKGMQLQFFQTQWKGNLCYLEPLKYRCVKHSENFLYRLKKRRYRLALKIPGRPRQAPQNGQNFCGLG